MWKRTTQMCFDCRLNWETNYLAVPILILPLKLKHIALSACPNIDSTWVESVPVWHVKFRKVTCQFGCGLHTVENSSVWTPHRNSTCENGVHTCLPCSIPFTFQTTHSQIHTYISLTTKSQVRCNAVKHFPCDRSYHEYIPCFILASATVHPWVMSLH